MKTIKTAKQMQVIIENQAAENRLGNVGEALRAALEKRKERECNCAARAAELGIELDTIPPSYDCPVEEHRAEYDLHEAACNIAEDLDNGSIFGWRVEQVKEHLRAGGKTAIDGFGDLYLWHPDKCLSVRFEDEGYSCGSNYCDDPACTFEHPEVL